MADAALGKIIEALKKKGVYKDTLILVLGDHGESLFDDGHLGHGFSLNEIQTRIPLIINEKGIEITQAVRTTSSKSPPPPPATPEPA